MNSALPKSPHKKTAVVKKLAAIFVFKTRADRNRICTLADLRNQLRNLMSVNQYYVSCQEGRTSLW